jgi:hypothetical protein
MMVRMDNAEASEAGRLLARARWGTATLDRAVVEVVSRASELTAEQRAELRTAATGMRPVSQQRET